MLQEGKRGQAAVQQDPVGPGVSAQQTHRSCLRDRAGTFTAGNKEIPAEGGIRPDAQQQDGCGAGILYQGTVLRRDPDQRGAVRPRSPAAGKQQQCRLTSDQNISDLRYHS